MSGFGDDTDIGGRRAEFPETPASAILAARSDDPIARARGFAALVGAYWKPVYKSIRIRFRKSNEDAKDLTQAFFTHALEGVVFQSYDPDRARFRIYVRTCLRNFVANQEEAARRLKRGGGALTLSLDFDDAEGEIDEAEKLADVSQESFEDAFDREVKKSLQATAVRELHRKLREKDKETYFVLFQSYDLAGDATERPTYAALAQEHGIKVTDVTNHLAYVRRELRRIVLSQLREITASDEEFRDEARELLGVEPGAID